MSAQVADLCETVGALTTDALPTRLADEIKAFLPWAHGPQRQAITTFVAAIIDQPTGCQAALARTQGHQAAAVQRLLRLLHNDRLQPQDFAEWLCRQALRQVPRTGRVRFTIDWTSEQHQHLLVVSWGGAPRLAPLLAR